VHFGMHFCSARQSAFAVHAVETGSWHAPPAETEFWRHVEHAGVALAGGVAQAVAPHSLVQGATPLSAPVPLHAQPSSDSLKTL